MVSQGFRATDPRLALCHSLSIEDDPRLHENVAIHEVLAHGKGHLTKRLLVPI